MKAATARNAHHGRAWPDHPVSERLRASTLYAAQTRSGWMAGPSPATVRSRRRNGVHMTPVIEILDGDEGWPLAETLDRQCYPPEVVATIIWRDVTWAHADKRIFVQLDGEPVCHAGLYLRDAKDGERDVHICGIGGVMTLERVRKQGCASTAMETATK